MPRNAGLELDMTVAVEPARAFVLAVASLTSRSSFTNTYHEAIMPLWKIYHPDDAFSAGDKKAIAEEATGLYLAFLPRFYVNVMFVPLPEATFYIGGEPASDFVRVTIDHIAQQMKDTDMQATFLKAVTRLFAPYVADRGLRWEMHIDETPFALWTIEGLRPPVPGTSASKKWQIDNYPSFYEA